jgi:ATP-binding cassette subfamily B (MDR/TAP) protein 1
VGLVGSSGCGKSTIMQLVLRFYEVDQGMILIDGRNIKDYDIYHLRGSFGVVTQEPVLFTGTIQENIRYQNTLASLEDVKEAARIANASQFI